MWHACGRRQRRGTAVGVHQVQERKRHVGGIGFEHTRGLPAGLARRSGSIPHGPEITQCPKLAGALHLLGRLLHGDQHTADRAAIIGNRAVGEREVGLLEKALSLDRQQQVLVPRRRAAGQDSFGHGPDDVPDFGPDLVAGRSDRPRMLVAKDGAVPVVVDLDEIGPPPDQHGESTAEHHADNGPQAGGPGFRSARARNATSRTREAARPSHRVRQTAQRSRATDPGVSLARTVLVTQARLVRGWAKGRYSSVD